MRERESESEREIERGGERQREREDTQSGWVSERVLRLGFWVHGVKIWRPNCSTLDFEVRTLQS